MNYAQDKVTIKCDEYLLQAAFECRAGDTVKKNLQGFSYTSVLISKISHAETTIIAQ